MFDSLSPGEQHVWNRYISAFSATTGADFNCGFTENPICHIYYLATTHVALPHHRQWLRRLPSPTSPSPRLSVCLIALSRSGTHACGCRAQQQPASQEIESSSGPRSRSTAGVLQSAARFCSKDPSVCQLCLERGKRSSTNIYAPTHTRTEPICIHVQSHTSTHIDMLTDSHSTPPKSHQNVRLFH